MIYRLVTELQTKTIPIQQSCRVLSVSRAGYYAARSRSGSVNLFIQQTANIGYRLRLLSSRANSILLRPIQRLSRTLRISVPARVLSQPEASVSVRGQVKYIAMSQQQYQYLRECDLQAALAESKADLAQERFVKGAVAQHIKRLKQMNKPAQ